ncbi:MAG: 6-pyruvoyl trahydropterin synthase family protein [Candidatus Omnitrophota bacterium]
MSWELVVKHKFAAAHFLQNYKGKCENMHGHTFEIEVYFKVAENGLNAAGIGIDFTEIKQYLRDILPDHQLLNEEFEFSPSAENLSRHFYYRIKEKFPVSRVVIWESENAAASYTEDQ